MNIVWDSNKAASNKIKHSGVSFEEAETCLFDPVAFVIEDPDASNEQRFILIGLSNSNRLLTVCYALPNDETVRIISARKATAKERASYA